MAKAEGSLATVEDELFGVARSIEGSDLLRSTLTDQAVPVELRQGIVEDLLQGKASPVTTALVSFVVGSGRAKDLPAIINKLVERAAAEREQVVAEVTSAFELDDATKQRLAEALSAHTGKRVSVKVVVDPRILGGIVAQVGDTVIDGSVRTRLNRLKETL